MGVWWSVRMCVVVGNNVRVYIYCDALKSDHPTDLKTWLMSTKKMAPSRFITPSVPVLYDGFVFIFLVRPNLCAIIRSRSHPTTCYTRGTTTTSTH